VWQFATYLFLHGGLLHLLFNAYALWTFGGELEALWGFSAFLRFFLVTGVGAGLFHALITPHALVPTIGASGALMGVLAAFAMTFPDRELFFWFIPIPMRARTLVVVFAVLSLGLGAMDSPDRIAHFAHLGGIGVGVLVLKAGMWRVKWQQWARLRKTRRRLGPLRRPTDEPGQQDVDGVLDRANEVGFDRLTEREKNVLKKASRNSKRKTPKP
jgi:membrane associated rhomboid family serine protease